MRKVTGFAVGILLAVSAMGSTAQAAERAFLGVMLGVMENKVVVENVAPGSTAEALKIRAGDELVSVNGKAIEPGNAAAFMEPVKAGDPITITVRREGAEVELRGTAMARPS